jgi:hypothetical protein
MLIDVWVNKVQPSLCTLSILCRMRSKGSAAQLEERPRAGFARMDTRLACYPSGLALKLLLPEWNSCRHLRKTDAAYLSPCRCCR